MKGKERVFAESAEITFKPLSGNRLRCNWPGGGVISVRQRNSAANRRRDQLRREELRGKALLAEQLAKPRVCAFGDNYVIKTSQISFDWASVHCPHCGNQIYSRSGIAAGEMRCGPVGCNKLFVACSPVLLISIRYGTDQVGEKYRTADCPYCSGVNLYAKLGTNKCEQCGRSFTGVDQTGTGRAPDNRFNRGTRIGI